MENVLNDMANLVFKGHKTRGKELHKLLENLGGVDCGYEQCSCVTGFYYINREGYIEGSSMIPDYMNHRIIMSLETFESKYPYKVGDRVRIAEYESEVPILSMNWNGYEVKYEVFTDETEWYSAKELNEYNEPNKKETMKKEISGAIIDRFICLEGYDFYDDKGNIIDTKEITMKKKKPKYPKTFVECAKILDCFCAAHIDGYYCRLLEDLQALLICRDAYWKIAGEQMGLGKPWKPDFTNYDEERYGIYTLANKVERDFCGVGDVNMILSFPTEEMRDAFYENFKELIEECKELL